MPMRLNVGLCRMMGDANFGSHGGSVNLEMEVDSALVQEPEKLKGRIRHLFALARQSLAEELASSLQRTEAPEKTASPNGTHLAVNSEKRHAIPPATAAQAKAILTIARRQRADLARLLQERFGAARLEALTVRQASQLIDELKSSPVAS